MERATLLDTAMITPSVKQFVFQRDEPLDFKPGQHTVLEIDDGDDVVKRPYTMVNLPGGDKFVIAVKRYDDGTGSVLMHDLDIGDTVRSHDAKGNLYLRDTDRDIAFVSTGTGASPMLAMLRECLREGVGDDVYWFHGERRQETRLYDDLLGVLDAEHDRLSVIHSLSDEDWSGRQGRVQSHVADVVGSPDGVDWYVCGVPQMVVDTVDLLEEHGVSNSQIFREGWESDAVA